MPATSASTTPRSATIIDEAYAAAGVKPGDIDTGVVILTGEALRRENAEAIAELLAEQGGDFVSATAGHHMESMLAAYGSGASKVSHDEGKRILNIDIGGGTTKLALVDKGDVIATAALHIGGRLQVVDDDRPHRAARPGGQISRPRRPASTGTRATCYRPRSSTRSPRAWPTRWSRRSRERPCRTRSSISTSPIRSPISASIDGMMFSGGVGEYVYGREDARLRRHGPPPRAGDPPARRCRRAALAAAAGRRMHPRHRARRLRIQRAAQRQHQLHLQARRAAAAPQSAGAAAAPTYARR